MKGFSKVCDAADWFDPEIGEIITGDLREVPRFHRKQWEFATIFRTLRRLGVLRSDSVGMSMGGGKERLLYALAPYVRRLIVTDLYDTETTWDCARTEDPEVYIRTDLPFDVDVTNLQALRMDMRELNFPERSFDFCYSTCAIEHIGEREDFLRHLDEVHRVLRDGGVYVFSTEISYDSSVIADPQNFIFSAPYLNDLLLASKLLPEEECDMSLRPHQANFPFPPNIGNLCHLHDRHISTHVSGQIPHVQLLRGQHPFSAVMFVMRKSDQTERPGRIFFRGLEASARFLASGIQEYRRLLNEHILSLHPFSALPSHVSRFFADHAEFFEQGSGASGSPDIFHSDYFWFGSGTRDFEVDLEVGRVPGDHPAEFTIRVHRYRTLASRDVDCVSEVRMACSRPGHVTQRLRVRLEDDSCYALLGHMVRGECEFRDIRITSSRAGEGNDRRVRTPLTPRMLAGLQS